jgi:hypothetical protein
MADLKAHFPPRSFMWCGDGFMDFIHGPKIKILKMLKKCVKILKMLKNLIKIIYTGISMQRLDTLYTERKPCKHEFLCKKNPRLHTDYCIETVHSSSPLDINLKTFIENA